MIISFINQLNSLHISAFSSDIFQFPCWSLSKVSRLGPDSMVTSVAREQTNLSKREEASTLLISMFKCEYNISMHGYP